MDSVSKDIPTLQLQLFGAPEIRLAGVTYPGLAAKTQALLFYLGMTRRPHLRTALAALLWADMPERDARGNLRKAIQQLQEQFGDYLTVDHHSLGLRADAPCWVDAVEFLNVAGGTGRAARRRIACVRSSLRRGIPRGVLCAEHAGV